MKNKTNLFFIKNKRKLSPIFYEKQNKPIFLLKTKEALTIFPYFPSSNPLILIPKPNKSDMQKISLTFPLLLLPLLSISIRFCLHKLALSLPLSRDCFILSSQATPTFIPLSLWYVYFRLFLICFFDRSKYLNSSTSFH